MRFQWNNIKKAKKQKMVHIHRFIWNMNTICIIIHGITHAIATRDKVHILRIMGHGRYSWIGQHYTSLVLEREWGVREKRLLRDFNLCLAIKINCIKTAVEGDTVLILRVGRTAIILVYVWILICLKCVRIDEDTSLVQVT